MKSKIIFVIIWIIVFTVPLITIYLNPFFPKKLNFILVLSLVQRAGAMLALLLLAIQIFLGAFMGKLTEKFGGWLFNVHTIQGIVIGILVLIHPLIYLYQNFLGRGVFDPFIVFTDVCLLCETKHDLYLTFGKLAFWGLGATIAAGILRTRPWWRKNWRYIHVLNYLLFFAIAIHSWFVGSDVKRIPFVYIFFLSVVVVTYTLAVKLLPRKS